MDTFDVAGFDLALCSVGCVFQQVFAPQTFRRHHTTIGKVWTVWSDEINAATDIRNTRVAICVRSRWDRDTKVDQWDQSTPRNQFCSAPASHVVHTGEQDICGRGGDHSIPLVDRHLDYSDPGIG